MILIPAAQSYIDSLPTQIGLFPNFQNWKFEWVEDTEELNKARGRPGFLQPFVIKKHRATRLHYDFRLGLHGVLKSWALPSGPSYCAGVPCEAVEVEDHKIRNIGFEGVLPKGMPGAGPTMPWDLGFWEPRPGYLNVSGSLRNGHLEFALHGKKLQGNWALILRPGSFRGSKRKLWDLIKLPDSFARCGDALAIVDEEPNSVLTGKSLEEVESGGRTAKKKGRAGAPLFEIGE